MEFKSLTNSENKILVSYFKDEKSNPNRSIYSIIRQNRKSAKFFDELKKIIETNDKYEKGISLIKFSLSTSTDITFKEYLEFFLNGLIREQKDRTKNQNLINGNELNSEIQYINKKEKGGINIFKSIRFTLKSFFARYKGKIFSEIDFESLESHRYTIEIEGFFKRKMFQNVIATAMKSPISVGTSIKLIKILDISVRRTNRYEDGKLILLYALDSAKNAKTESEINYLLKEYDILFQEFNAQNSDSVAKITADGKILLLEQSDQQVVLKIENKTKDSLVTRIIDKIKKQWLKTKIDGVQHEENRPNSSIENDEEIEEYVYKEIDEYIDEEIEDEYYKLIQLVSKRSKIPYNLQLLDSRWKSRRSQIIKRDNEQCKLCNVKYSETNPLQVHHQCYIIDYYAWDYPGDELITYCKKCHQEWHRKNQVKHFKIVDGKKHEVLKRNKFERKTCERCNGRGYIPYYSHVQNGVCFKCGGDGYLNNQAYSGMKFFSLVKPYTYHFDV